MDEPSRSLKSTSTASIERFSRTLEERRFLRDTRRLLVAASGGPDSTALAFLFHDLQEAGGSPGLEVLLGHVHHGIRGAEADGDEEFVRALAERLGFPLLVARGAVPELSAGEGLSLEAAGRKLRYRTFRGWAEEHAIDAFALGHQREDQEETILLRLARGTGLRGLRGIPEERPLEGEGRPARIIRPLLDWSRREILAFLEKRGIGWRIDSSNRALACPRNVIRNEVLPLLESKVHGGVRAALLRLLAHGHELGRDLELLARRAWNEALVRVEDGEVVLRREALLAWPPSVRRLVVLEACERLAPAAPPLSRSSWRRIEELLAGPVAAGELHLPGSLRFELRYGSIRMRFSEGGRSLAREGAAGTPAAIEIAIDGEPSRWEEWRIGAERWAGAPGRGEGRLEEWIDAGALAGGLQVRGRLPGDRLHPLGAPGRKRLKEFFRERRIPPGRRPSVPLVVSGGEIVWVVGERLDHRFRVREETKSIVRLRAWKA
jgi:tRNA(Ile)-lysidine synthase